MPIHLDATDNYVVPDTEYYYVLVVEFDIFSYLQERNVGYIFIKNET